MPQLAMPILPPVETWTAKEAEKALAALATAGVATAQRYLDGDHWQSGDGWIGQRPPADDPNGALTMLTIQQGFVFENAIRSVVNRHTDGVLGHEPSWGVTVRRPLKKDEAPTDAEAAAIGELEAALTAEWWDRNRPLDALRDAARHALASGRGVLRVFIPPGLRDQNGTVSAQDFAGALRLVRVDAPDPTTAGVYTDPLTFAEIGIFRYEIDNTKYTELSYLDQAQNTVVRVLSDKGDQTALLPLGGLLLMREISRERIVTDSVIQLQRLINLARTMMARAINMAGFRERMMLNAQPPGRWLDSDGRPATRSTPQDERVFKADDFPIGAGVTTFVAGLPLYDGDNNLTGYTNPNVNYGEPVDPAHFIKTRDDAYAAILGESNQRHTLINGDAVASGEARKQARAEFESDLRPTARGVEQAGRWLVEITATLAGTIAGGATVMAAYRPVFDCRVDSGPLSADEMRAITERHAAGELSLETTMAEQGVADVDAELEQIRKEQDERAANEEASLRRLSLAGGVAEPQPLQDNPGNNNPGTGNAA